MKTKLTDKQKAEVAQAAHTAGARPSDDKFAKLWADITSNDPAIHGKRLARQPFIRAKGK